MDFLYKISKQKQDCRYEMKTEHYHEYYELYYLISGKRKMFLNDKVYHVHAGDLMAISKEEIHRTSYLLEEDKTPMECERITICFSDQYVKDLVSEIGRKAFLVAFAKHQIKIPSNRRAYFEGLLERILEESKQLDEYSELLCKKYCEEMVLFVIRCQKLSQQTVEEQKIVDTQMMEAVQFINGHFQEDITLSLMAQKASMSESYFSKRFKRITGFGFKEYLNTVRIRHACNLLLTTDLTITQISEACGYMDSNYFGDAFKKVKNLSPRDYRKAKIV